MVRSAGLKALNKGGMVPLYRQLAQIIEKGIRDGSFAEGSRLPSEPELMRQFGVSRVTVRLAMDDLLARSLIVRKQGLGTFVKKPMMTQEVDDLFGFYPSLLSKGIKPKIKILNYEMVTPDREAQKKLELGPGAKTLRFSRQYLLDRSLIVIIQIHIPGALSENWTRKDASTQNSFRLLEEKAGVQVLRSSIAIRASSASGRIGEWLRVPKGSPVLELRRLSFSSGKRPVEYAVLFFPGGSYELAATIFAGSKNSLKLDRR